MKMRWFAVLGASSLLALAACTVTEGSGGSGGGGNGAGGGSTTSTTTSTTSSSTTTSSTTGQGGGGGDPGPCITCGEYLADQTLDPNNLCDTNGPPSSGEIFDSLGACICAACAECAENLCAGQAPDEACNTCVTNTVLAPNNQGGCNEEFVACSNDAG